MYLLDTGVVFELRKARAGRTDPVFASWASGLARQNLFISAITLLELDNGAARVGRGDKTAGLALREWIDNQVMAAFDGRILPVDVAVVRRRAQLPYADARDGLLAAILHVADLGEPLVLDADGLHVRFQQRDEPS